MPDDTMEPAQREAERVLRPKLEALAAEHGVRLSVALYPPWRNDLGKPGVDAVYREVIEAAETGRSDVNRRYQIHVAVGEGASAADLSFFAADDPLVANQVRKDVEGLLRKL
jgi:hypothetical protein